MRVMDMINILETYPAGAEMFVALLPPEVSGKQQGYADTIEFNEIEMGLNGKMLQITVNVSADFIKAASTPKKGKK